MQAFCFSLRIGNNINFFGVLIFHNERFCAELKKRNKIRPTGFVVGNKNLYLTNSDGTLLVSDLEKGNILSLKKISRSLIPKPFIFNEGLYLESYDVK